MPLVFVPTPLGNLRDITLRALDVLRDADLIVAEDTRVTRKLLHALALPMRTIWSYREQNAEGATPEILSRAQDQLVAVVSDAGMPGVSDPGSDLVAAARAAGIAVEVLPGPSAALGVAVLSGFPLRRFCFEGFPPRTSGARKSAFRDAFAHGATTVWYESPQRIHATLRDLAQLAPDATVFVLREYTKKFEEQLLGTPAAVLARLAEPVRGEISFAVAPVQLAAAQAPASVGPAQAIDALLDEGRSTSEIAKLLAERGYGEKRELYTRVGERKRERGMGNGVAAETA